MLLHPVDLTSALRPALVQDEILLFVQDAVGLYSGNLKVPEYQNGQIYLTSHRACYIDNDQPRAKAVAVLLKDVERCDLYTGFLKSSPKVTLYPKAAKHFGRQHQHTPSVTNNEPQAWAENTGSGSRAATPKPAPSTATWICPICSFSNSVPPNFDPATADESTPLPSCQTCGLQPPLMTVVKAAIAGVSRRSAHEGLGRERQDRPGSQRSSNVDTASHICPRCTFDNHPSMTSCEICGAPLTPNVPAPPPPPPATSGPDPIRASSPAPVSNVLVQALDDPMEPTKFSFRSGGEKIFHDRLKGALVQRKWLLQNAPATPRLDSPTPSGDATPPARRNIGISGLERHDSELRQTNEVVIGNAFEDLSALMASAKDIITLAENFSKQNKANGLNPAEMDQQPMEQANALLSSLNLTTTKDMLGASSSSSAQHNTYLTQLARSVADFVLDDTGGTDLLKSSGGIISLVDLWAVFNRARGGVELVSPMDFNEAVELFEKLRLPVQARQFRASGLRVVRSPDWNDERIIKALTSWLQELRGVEAAVGDQADSINWGRGVTALEVADRFGWSVGVASEELEMAEENGALCRETGVEGIKFWPNWFAKDLAELFGEPLA